MKPRRYMLFVGDNYYASGGVDDLIGSYDTFHEARCALKDEPVGISGSWAQIFDVSNGRTVRFNGIDAGYPEPGTWIADAENEPRSWGTPRGGKERRG